MPPFPRGSAVRPKSRFRRYSARRIGIDELSYRKHHEYLTVVVDHRRGRVIWARPGRSAATLKEFFDELGPERRARLERVSIDMSGAYKKAVREAAPQATIAICEGAVLGGGFGVACVADVAFAHVDAGFGLPETGLGIVPAQIAPFVVQRIGLSQARRAGGKVPRRRRGR